MYENSTFLEQLQRKIETPIKDVLSNSTPRETSLAQPNGRELDQIQPNSPPFGRETYPNNLDDQISSLTAGSRQGSCSSYGNQTGSDNRSLCSCQKSSDLASVTQPPNSSLRSRQISRYSLLRCPGQSNMFRPREACISRNRDSCLYININDNEIVETFNESNYSILLSFDIIILFAFLVIQLIVISILVFK